jgi:hypothetical protein
MVISSQAQSGTAIVEVITEPAINGEVGFSGTPNGQVMLPQGSISTPRLSSDSYVSTINYIDPILLAANYSLTSVSCDDEASPAASIGDVGNASATFNLDPNETVVCIFKFTKGDEDNEPGDGGNGDDGGNGEDGGGNDDGEGEGDDGACICPQQGAWKVSNLIGQMACTGVMSMNVPLPPGNATGNIESSNSCRTLTASGLSEDEATITFQRLANCNYKGTVGGTYESIPMEIDFTLNVADQHNMSGSLHSVVNHSGMTCTMTRDYTLTFSN